MATVTQYNLTISRDSSQPAERSQNNSLWMDVDRGFKAIEYSMLNPTSYVPVVGIFSAGARAAFGTLQATIGTIGVVCELGLAILTLPKPSWSLGHLDNASLCLGHIAHGFLNECRASYEWIPCLPLVTTMPYDLAGHKVWPYRSEVQDAQPKIVYVEREKQA